MCGKKRIIAVLVMMAVFIALLGGCGEFDADGYTKGILDVTYKNETEQYMKLTGSTKKAADQIFIKNLDSVMTGFSNLELPKQLEDKYRKMFEKLIKSVKYTVSEAKEDGDGNFTVDVSVEPITIFDDTYKDFQNQAKAYATKVSNDVMNGSAMPIEEEMQNHIYELYYSILNSVVENGIHYGKKEIVTVHVNKGEGGIYEIPGADITALDNKMLSQKVLR